MKKKDKERAYAEELRREGKSYKEIREAIAEKFNGYIPSSGTLNGWVSCIELTSEQEEALLKRKTANSSKNGIAGAKVLKEKKKQRIAETKANITYNYSPQELQTAGLMLYWGEGAKTEDSRVSLSNSDPVAHRLFIKWLEECYDVNKDNLHCYLHLHEGLDVDAAISFWCDELGITKEQFSKPYIKKKNNSNHRKNKLYNGTLAISVFDTQLHYRVMFEIDRIKENFS